MTESETWHGIPLVPSDSNALPSIEALAGKTVQSVAVTRYYDYTAAVILCTDGSFVRIRPWRDNESIGLSIDRLSLTVHEKRGLQVMSPDEYADWQRRELFRREAERTATEERLERAELARLKKKYEQ